MKESKNERRWAPEKERRVGHRRHGCKHESWREYEQLQGRDGGRESVRWGLRE